MKLLIRIRFYKEIPSEDFCSSLLYNALKERGFKPIEKNICEGHIVTMICDDSIKPLMNLYEILRREKKTIEKVDVFEVGDCITIDNMVL